MKKLIVNTFAALVCMAGAASAAVTFSIANVTGSTSGPNGLPIVDSAGVPLATGAAFASIGTFNTLPNWATANASTVLSLFSAVDATPVGILATRAGLFNAQDYSSATNVYPEGFKGKIGYIVVGNNANVALSTAIAVFSLGTVFPEQDGANNATYNIPLTSNTSSVLYGSVRSVTSQPNPASTTPFLNGVQLVSVPEPSAALLGALGALGLLRRRRA